MLNMQRNLRNQHEANIVDFYDRLTLQFIRQDVTSMRNWLEKYLLRHIN